MPQKCLGFILSDEDLAFEEKAKREAEEFFKTYGKVHRPTPEPEKIPEWLTEPRAASYARIPQCVIKALGQSGYVTRREYLRSNKNIYYEYNVADIERYLKHRNGAAPVQGT